MSGTCPNPPTREPELGLTYDRTVLAALPRVLVMFGVKHGLSPEELCSGGEFNAGDVADPDRQVPYGWLLTITRLLGRQLPGIDLPLEIARFATIDQFGYLGQALKHAGTPLAALDTLARYAGLLDSSLLTAPIRLESNPATVLVTVSDESSPNEAKSQALLAAVVGIVRALGGPNLAPRELRFARAPHDLDPRTYSFFRCPVSFGWMEDAVVFDRAPLDREGVHADGVAARSFNAHVDVLLEQLDQPFVTRVSLAIASLLSRGDLSQRRISRYLALSQRSLQRKLHQHGLKYSTLVENTRKSVALRALLDPGRSIAEVAGELGYRDASSFSRVFKRWTGLYPHTYRTRQRARLA